MESSAESYNSCLYPEYATSSGQIDVVFNTDNPNIRKLITVIGTEQFSVKQMMELIGLKERVNFQKLYFTPAFSEDEISQ